MAQEGSFDRTGLAILRLGCKYTNAGREVSAGGPQPHALQSRYRHASRPELEALFMISHKTREASKPGAHLGGQSDRMGESEKVVVDAIAAAVEKHRRKLDTVSLSPEIRRFMQDLLDAVLLDVLQTVLNEASALEVLRSERRARH